MVRSALPQPRVGRGGPALDLGQVGQRRRAGARAHRRAAGRPRARKSASLRAYSRLVAARGSARLPALLDPAADHEHRAEQHEQRVDDAVQDDHHDRAEHERAEGRGDAEARARGLARLLRGRPAAGHGPAPRVRGGRLNGIVPARLAWRSGSTGRPGFAGGDGEGDVAGLEDVARTDLGRLLGDPPALDPGAVDRTEVGDRGPRPPGLGCTRRWWRRDAVVVAGEIALRIAADERSAGR